MLKIREWEQILSFLSICDLSTCSATSKQFTFIRKSELLAKNWLQYIFEHEDTLSTPMITETTRIMAMFHQTELFRIFARIIPYKMDNLQKKCMTINIYNEQFRKYLPLFRYSCKSPDTEQLLFRKCQFTENNFDSCTKLKEGTMA
eukprot:391334_1